MIERARHAKRRFQAASVVLVVSIFACSKKRTEETDDIVPVEAPASVRVEPSKANPPQSPEENYVSAAIQIGCLGLKAIDAARFAAERARILSSHGYSEESWRDDSKRLATAKGDEIVKAMKVKCGS